MARKEDEPLPVFIAEKFAGKMPGAAIVACPYENCQGMFVVGIAMWYKPRKYRDWKGREYTITGRSCPYCQRVGSLPPRSRIR